VVGVLANGSKCRGFEPGKGDGFLRTIKIRSTHSFGWEVKPEVHVVRFYSMLNNTWSPTGRNRLNSHFLRPFSYSFHRCLCWQDRQSTGGCQSALVDKLGFSPSRSIITWSTSQSPEDNKPQFWEFSLTPTSTNVGLHEKCWWLWTLQFVKTRKEAVMVGPFILKYSEDIWRLCRRHGKTFAFTAAKSSNVFIVFRYSY
jgi:hypothetical protein